MFHSVYFGKGVIAIMKKLICLSLAAALLAVSLAACGSDSSSSAPAQDSSAPASQSAASDSAAASGTSAYNLDDIVTAIEAANPVTNPRELDDFALENQVMLNMDNVADFSGKVSNDNANSALILAIQAQPGKAEDVKADLESYKSSLTTGMYAEFAEKEAQAKDARIVVKGDYVVMVIANTEGASYSDIDTAVDSALN